MSAVFYCSQALPGGFFCYNKGVLMQKVSYMGNGSTTEFYFNFPYFENSNVVVTKNNQTATGYNVIGNSGGLDADIPYTGGKVVFETAPGALDNITISRSLPLSRVADYQPTARIEPTTLNQDLNYLMEVIKDRKDELDELCTQYSEIADKESTTTLLARISAIHDEIVEIDAKITALGDVSQIRNDITTLKGYDYVIESQTPTSQNNYTWYRKYKSGWVEQGGLWVGNTSKTLPVPMQNANYSLFYSLYNNENNDSVHLHGQKIHSQTATAFTIKTTYNSQEFNYTIYWQASGFAES